MDKEKTEELLKNYEAGTSSLSEEEILRDKTKHLDSSSTAWFGFLKKSKAEAPEGLKDDIWHSIQKKRVKTQRLTISIVSVAASLVFFVSAFIYLNYKKQTYKQKKALLTEALNMFEQEEGQKPIKQNIIYEDDMIIIYSIVE